MEITLRSLEYLLSFSVPLCPLDEAAEDQRLSGIKLWNGYDPSWNVLYMITPQRLRTLRETDPRQLRVLTESYCLACPEPVSDLNILCPQKPMDLEDFFNYIQDCFLIHETWITEVRDTLRQTRNPRAVFPYCGAFLHALVRLFDNDYNILASSVQDTPVRMPLDNLNALIQEEEFRYVKERRDVFEYTSDTPSKVCLCYNIFLNDTYFARLVGVFSRNISLRGPSSLLAEMGELLTEFYLYQPPGSLCAAGSKELIHALTMLLSGSRLDPTAGEQILKQVGWKPEDPYLVIQFEFMVQVSLDYFSAQIETIFTGCRVIVLEEKIYCVMNLSASVSSEQDFWQRLPVFLRDSLCKAGVSNICHSFQQLYNCRLEAEAAIRLGKIRQESFWYYKFPDYIMDYMAEAATACLPAENLCHSSIYILRQYDKENDTLLTESLRQYLIHQGNVSHAAGAMFVHRTTMVYRIEKIQQLTGLCLDDPVTRLHLEWSFYLLGDRV